MNLLNLLGGIGAIILVVLLLILNHGYKNKDKIKDSVFGKSLSIEFYLALLIFFIIGLVVTIKELSKL